jgi:tetratricopeptide (TPR) repeat protein
MVKLAPVSKGTKIGLSIAAAVFFLLACLTAYSVYQVAEFVAGKAAFEKGYAAEYRSEFAAAIADFDIALSKPITRYWRAYALENRAYCYQQLRRSAEAIRDYSEALRLIPELPDARAGRGFLYEEAGERDLAFDDYNQAIRLNPNLGKVWYHRGLIYMRLRDYQKARSDFREAIRCFPDFADAYLEAGYASYDLKDNDGALSGFEVAINLNPKDARAYAARGAIYRQRKDYAKAVSDFSEAIRLAPRNADYLVYRAVVYANEDRRTEEIADLTEALRLNPRSEIALCRRGRAYRSTKEYPRAIADFTELVRITQAGGAYKERARTYFRSGQYALALADYQQASAYPGGTVKSETKTMAWLLATCPDPQFRNGPEAVIQALKDCEQSEWHDSLDLDTLAAAYAETGQFDEAVRYELQAIALKDGDAEWEAKLEKRLALYQERQPYREELNK